MGRSVFTHDRTGSLILSSFLFLFFCATVSAQDSTDFFTSDFLRYEDHIYADNIKTVTLEQEGIRLSEPIIELGGSDRLLLSFDDLDGDFKNYNYTLIHCDYNWQPSNLNDNEYLAGFAQDRIENYRSSFNTLQPYTHYELLIPGRDVRPMLSGNYLLKVYTEDAPDKPVITRRLMIVQNRATIEATVQRATIVNDMNSRQEIDFSVFHKGLSLANPFEDIKVVLMQNGRWDNAITGLKPLFLKEEELDYSYDEENTFSAGNEYRTFDLRTLRIYTQFVKDIIKAESGYTVVVAPGISRSFDRYVTENDINGKFLIRNQDGRDDKLESEYVSVKFALKHEILTNGNFYVFGALSDWKLNASNKMVYNEDEGTYEALLYLKQGYYDYQYVFLQDGKRIADESIVEGSHFETENKYTILVYYRPVGGRYDQLVGFKKLTTR
jgi:hypothetical protein